MESKASSTRRQHQMNIISSSLRQPSRNSFTASLVKVLLSTAIFKESLGLHQSTNRWTLALSCLLSSLNPFGQFSRSVFGFMVLSVFILVSSPLVEAKPPADYSSADSWVSEELWPKEKSIIHIKLVKPLPKEIPIWESRNKDNYLSDINLDFDSPYKTLHLNSCVISLKSYYDGYSEEANNQEIARFATNIQAQISGGLKCKDLPLETLTPLSANLTHLVVRDTGIVNITKFLFGANKLDKLVRLDIIGNQRLTSIQARAFDGLPRVNYLSIINNQVQELALESFAGLKNLEELIYLGNGDFWDQQYFNKLLRAVSVRILPNLIHLHVCGSKVNERSVNHHEHNYDTWRVDMHLNTTHQQRTENIVENTNYNKQKVRSDSISSSSFSSSSPASSFKRHLHSQTGIKINKNDFVDLTQVKYLQLSDCDINFIHSSALIPLIKNIVGLNLGGNPKLRINNLKSVLPVFYVNNLKSYRLEAEQRLANSSFLTQRNSPVKIGLEKLDLSYSIDTLTVPKDLLTVISKTSVTELYMKNVSWKKIREGDIPPMPNLKVLHIDHSQIEYLDERAFNGLEELVKLSLRGNYIRQIPLFLLEPLRKLENLDLSGYKEAPGSLKGEEASSLLEIPRKAFVHGTHLKEVNLSYKNLTQLARYLFIGLFKLEKLHLRGCNLQYIEYLTFFPLKSIVYIDLSENKHLIKNVRSSGEDTFVGLEAIEMIRLSNCDLTSEDINDFNLFRRMHEHVHLLDLSHNQIDFINGSTLQNFSELRHIDLSHNMIRSWHNYTIFSKNTFITTLDISNNQLTHITPVMLGDFRNLKNLSFALNPLQCECDWDGPLLLLDQKQKKGGQHLHHQKIQDHIEQLVHRQQEIVSTAFASSQAPPKSIIEWLNTTTIHFLRDRHPLRSNGHYFCLSSQSAELPPTTFKEFFLQDCPNYLALRVAKVSAAMLALITCTLLLLAVFFLVIAFIYNSTIRNLLTMVDDDFLHNYQYDAFVSYNTNDSDWVFNKLIPNLEEIPSDHQENSASYLGPDKAFGGQSIKSHIKLCVYDRDFIAGRPISECITESIRNSRKVILVISNNFARSPWCRFETDLAHNTLMDQNREGLILIKLEEMNSEMLEKIAPQIHFLLKTRIYLSWSTEQREQEIFWRKLRRALGFNKPYGTVKQYYKSYVSAFSKDQRHSVMLAATKDNMKVSFSKNSQQGLIESVTDHQQETTSPPMPVADLEDAASNEDSSTKSIGNSRNGSSCPNMWKNYLSKSCEVVNIESDHHNSCNRKSISKIRRSFRNLPVKHSQRPPQRHIDQNQQHYFNPEGSLDHESGGTRLAASYRSFASPSSVGVTKDSEVEARNASNQCLQKQLDDLQGIIIEKCRKFQSKRINTDQSNCMSEYHYCHRRSSDSDTDFLEDLPDIVGGIEREDDKKVIREETVLLGNRQVKSDNEAKQDHFASNCTKIIENDKIYRYNLKKKVKANFIESNEDADDENPLEDTDQDSTSGISINGSIIAIHDGDSRCNLNCRSELSGDDSDSVVGPRRAIKCKHRSSNHFTYSLPSGSNNSLSSPSISLKSLYKVRYQRTTASSSEISSRKGSRLLKGEKTRRKRRRVQRSFQRRAKQNRIRPKEPRF